MLDQFRLYLILALILAFAGAVFYFVETSRTRTLAAALGARGLRADLQKFAVSRENQMVVKNKTVIEWLAENGKVDFKATAIENAGEAAMQFFEQKLFDLNSQFNRGVSPYPGVVSQVSQCPKEFLPLAEDVRGEGWEGRLITTFANGRRQFGVCEAGEREYDVTILLLHCKARDTVFDLTAFSPRDASATIKTVLLGSACL